MRVMQRLGRVVLGALGFVTASASTALGCGLSLDATGLRRDASTGLPRDAAEGHATDASVPFDAALEVDAMPGVELGSMDASFDVREPSRPPDANAWTPDAGEPMLERDVGPPDAFIHRPIDAFSLPDVWMRRDGLVIGSDDAGDCPMAAMNTTLQAWYPFCGLQDRSGFGRDLTSVPTFEVDGRVGRMTRPGASVSARVADAPITAVAAWIRVLDRGRAAAPLIELPGTLRLALTPDGFECSTTGSDGRETSLHWAVPSLDSNWRFFACGYHDGRAFFGLAADDISARPVMAMGSAPAPATGVVCIGAGCALSVSAHLAEFSDVRLTSGLDWASLLETRAPPPSD